ncbi:TetR/AcrR family transcriptional regulator [Nocardioides jejuensis]|uniref:TetR/AcrR family transcriptional regulator n=1 Tax=Nocardioides jejuensis TaxID=2502782 RepID=A0A4R1C1N8_9ACTN|nr:TetR/AcrR family transcriptional regulator [Nocardioides jejuensis]TCJ23938.1 TetR/AcrR family transcriptional regulator [Nocardioides jejuensis]
MATSSSAAAGLSNGIPERLIDAAVAMLAEEGPSAIKARTVAARAGMSSMVVYNYFGGVPELLSAVEDHGFHQLGAAFAAVGASEDPVADLFTMALTTLAFARTNPHLYDAMFGLSTRATYRPTPTKAERRAGHSPAFNAAYAHVIAAAARLGVDGGLAVEDPRAAAGALWSFVHGYVSLDLANHFAEFDDPVRQVLVPMGVTFCVGLGADRASALASHEAALLRAWHPGS